jgi:parallel beta-helix repeat protein
MEMVKKSIFIVCLFLLFCSLLGVLYLKFVGVDEKTANSYSIYNLNTSISYNTIQEALDAPETLDGHTIFVEQGLFHEHIVVKKAVFLVGAGMQNTILDGDGNGTVISIQSSAVVDGFTIQNGSIGIALDFSSSGRISNNSIQHNEQGLCLFNSNNWTISGNLMTDNYDASIILNSSDNNTIKENVVSNNHFHFHDALNLYNSSFNSISNNSLTDNQVGAIQLNDYSLHNNVSNNLLMNNLGGIQLVKSCNYNVIERNSIIVNEMTWGLTSSIWIRESEYNMVYANMITSNRTSSWYKPPYIDGVGLSKSTNNSIVSNTISLMDTGVGFHYYCDNNSVIGNTLTRNGRGVDFSEGVSNGNAIYSNNFIENAEQVYNVLSTNIWDGGYSSGGNYWSNYETRYPNATEIDSSGIWDTPYVIDQNNVDRYPLKSTFLIPESSEFLIPPLLMTATLLAVIVYGRKNTTRCVSSKN